MMPPGILSNLETRKCPQGNWCDSLVPVDDGGDEALQVLPPGGIVGGVHEGSEYGGAAGGQGPPGPPGVQGGDVPVGVDFTWVDWALMESRGMESSMRRRLIIDYLPLLHHSLALDKDLVRRR